MRSVTDLLARLGLSWPARGTLRARFVHGTLWSLAGALASRILVLVAAVIAARLLDKEGFGEFAMIQTTVSMFGQYAGFGLSLTATRHIAELRFSDAERCGRIVSLTLVTGLVASTATAILMALLAPVISSRALGAAHLTNTMRLAGLLLFFAAQAGVVQGILSGFEDFPALARVELLQGLVSCAATFPMVTWLGVSGAILAVTTGQASACLAALAMARARVAKAGISGGLRGCWQERGVLLRFSTPGFLSGALIGPANWIASALIVNLPRGFSQLAGYNAANQWRSGILFGPMMMRRVSLPMLASLHGVQDYERFRRALRGSLAVNVGATLGLAIPAALLSPLIMGIYGDRYRADWDILVILAGVAVLESVVIVVTQVAASLGNLWWELSGNVLWASCLAAGTALLAPALGARGLGLALGIAVALQLCVNVAGAIRCARRVMLPRGASGGSEA